MPTREICPICRSNLCNFFGDSDHQKVYDCSTCGRFKVNQEAFDDYLEDGSKPISKVQRAVLSYRIRNSSNDHQPPTVFSEWIERLTTESRLPTPAIQATNLVRLIGDRSSAVGEAFQLDESTYARIGAPDEKAVHFLTKQLVERGLLYSTGQGVRTGFEGGAVHSPLYDLSLDGWKEYEAERTGRVAGRYGFIAMKFNDPALEDFTANVVKPAVKAGIGFDLIDVRDVSKAGIIDNIMRSTIRDAAFVLVDLTHDNSGAYWEAGYAEGLGKPVIYLCERSKFEKSQSHFDTNHCTTVLWSDEAATQFGLDLTATLRRSMNLF